MSTKLDRILVHSSNNIPATARLNFGSFILDAQKFLSTVNQLNECSQVVPYIFAENSNKLTLRQFQIQKANCSVC